MDEENNEYLGLLPINDVVRSADALGDMLYIIVVGDQLLEHGIAIQNRRGFWEIQRSNIE